MPRSKQVGYEPAPQDYEELKQLFLDTVRELHTRNTEVGEWAIRWAAQDVAIKRLADAVPASWRQPNAREYWFAAHVQELVDKSATLEARFQLRRAVATHIIEQWRQHGGSNWSQAEVDRWLIQLANNLPFER